jgi:hypothetical protein
MTRIIPRTRNTMQGRPAFICGGASDFALAGLYLPIRCSGCYRTEVISRRETFSLLFAWMLLAGCGQNVGAKPDLPQSVSPGWRLSSFDRSGAPEGVSADGEPQCWKAEYAGQGSAQVWTCWYKERANAFEAAQRTRAEAQAVKFQEGSYLVLVRWNNAPKANISALVRAVEKATAPK